MHASWRVCVVCCIYIYIVQESPHVKTTRRCLGFAASIVVIDHFVPLDRDSGEIIGNEERDYMCGFQL